MTTFTGTASQTTILTARGTSMSDIRLVRDYPHPPAKVWRVLTEPPLMALLGMRPEGYAPVVGTRFRLVGKPNPGWRGFVECEVLEAREPSVLVYRWDDDGKNRRRRCATRSSRTPAARASPSSTRGSAASSGFLFTRLIMGPGWRKTLGTLSSVLADLAG